MSDQTHGFGRIALHGGLATGSAQIVKMGLQLTSVVVLARLLSPEDFGLVAAVGPLIAFVAIFQNLGLQHALIQRQELEAALINQIFWVTSSVSVGAALLLTAFSPVVAWFYDDARLGPLTIASCLPMIIWGLASTPISLMNRQMRFARLAVNDVLVAVVSLAAAVGAALAGFSYWSLVIAAIAAGVTGLTAAAWTVGWKPGRPAFRIDGATMSFGADLTGFNLVNFFARNLDNVLIARFAGPVELGYYDRAYRLLLFPLQNVLAPLSRIMIPMLSRVQDDPERFRRIYLRTCWTLAFAIVPGVAALGMTATDVVLLLFGERWLPVAPIFVWLSIAGLIQPLSFSTGWIFISQGRTRTMFRWGVYGAATTIGAFVAGLPWGATGVAAAYALSGLLLRVPVLTVVVGRVGPIRALDYLALQFLFVASSLCAYTVLPWVPLPPFGPEQPLRIAAAILASYGFAAVFALAFPPCRRSLTRVAVDVWAILRPERAALT